MSLEVKTVHDVDGKYFLIKIMLCIEKSNILNQRGIGGFIYIYLYRNYIFFITVNNLQKIIEI